MCWKLLTLIAALMLVTTSASPSNVAAQDPPEKTRLLVVAGIGTDQELELYYWRQRPSPLDHTSSDRVFFNYHYFHNAVIDVGVAGGDDQCAGTVQSTVQAPPGFNTLKVRMGEGNESLLINGEDVPLSESCLIDAKRVVIAVAAPGSHGRAQQQASDRGVDAEFGLQLARHFSPVGHSIRNPDGSTAASDGGTFFLHKDLQGSSRIDPEP